MSSELADIDKKFDKEFEDMKNATETSKEAQKLAEIAMNAASGTRGLFPLHGDVVRRFRGRVE